MGLGAVGGRGCVVEVVGRVERRQRWLGENMRHEGQKEGRRRTMVGQLRWVWWGGSFSGVGSKSRSLMGCRSRTSEREIVYSAVSLELEKYLLSRYRFHIRQKSWYS